MSAALTTFEIRPVDPKDASAIEALIRGLDAEDRYLRWFSHAIDVDQVLRWAVHPDGDGVIGFLAVSDAEAVGHGVLIPLADGLRGEVAFEVAAPWRRHGIATALLRALERAAVEHGLQSICADVLYGNTDMLAVFRDYGPHTEMRSGGVVTFTIPVAASAAA